MEEIIEIKNFSCIEYARLKLNKINILIGPQAAGKSLTAKLLYFFKNIFIEIKNIEDLELTLSGFERFLKEKFLIYFPKDTWNSRSFTIRYTFGDVEIEVNNKNQRLQIIYSDALKDFFKLYKSLYDETVKKIEMEDVSSLAINIDLQYRFIREIRKEYGNPVGFKQIFIPAGRSFFASIQSSIFTMLSDNRDIDPFLVEFGSYYEITKRSYHRREEAKRRKTPEIIEGLLEDILQSKYVRLKGKDYLTHKDARQIKINMASSGQQEVLPLALILERVSRVPFFANKGATLYIEEPEAHLYPQSQKSMVELIAAVANLSYAPLQFIITTHSPYILSSFNNLLEAGNIIKEFPEKMDRVKEIVDEKTILCFDELRTYSLENGLSHNIMDEEMRLISPTVLDHTSNEISIQFGHLLDL